MSQPPLIHQIARVNGIHLHYVTAGSGPLVILLHGFPQCWYSWHRQIGPLAEHNTVVAVDQRGYNTSSKPAGLRAYGLDYLIEDVRALIGHLGAQDAAIVGHDWGGMVAWTLAQAYPACVRRLAVLNIPHPGVFGNYIKQHRQQMLRLWYAVVFQIPWLPERLIRLNNFALLKRPMLSWPKRPGTFTPQDLRIYQAAWQQPGALTAMINWYRADNSGHAVKRVHPDGTVDVPTHMIWGTNDAVFPKATTYGTERLVPDLKITYLEGISHWVQEEAPDEVNAVLVPFVNDS